LRRATADGGMDGAADAAQASKRRILEAGGRWNQVLGVAASASEDDVKAAYRKLALLHHPDKGGDVDTFKQVKQAYEQGLAKSAKRPQKKATAKAKGRPSAKGAAAKAKAAPAREETPRRERTSFPAAATAAAAASENGRGTKRARPKPVPFDASKAKLRGALQKWESSRDFSQKTNPDDVPAMSPKDVAVLMRMKSCLLVDTREEHESEGSRVLGATRVSFLQLMTEPEVVAPQVAKLYWDGRKIVLVSQQAERMGRCALLATVLLDVFGFDEAKVCRMAGGFVSWKECVEADPVLRAEERLALASEAKASVDAQIAAAKAELDPWEEASGKRLKALVEGDWDSPEEARAHLDGLGPRLMDVEAEESLTAMLAVAVLKKPDTRGKFDKLVFEELRKRFAAKLEGLMALHSELAAAAAEHAVEAEAAKESLEAAQAGTSSPADGAPSGGQASSMAAEEAAEVNGGAEGGEADTYVDGEADGEAEGEVDVDGAEEEEEEEEEGADEAPQANPSDAAMAEATATVEEDHVAAAGAGGADSSADVTDIPGSRGATGEGSPGGEPEQASNEEDDADEEEEEEQPGPRP